LMLYLINPALVRFKDLSKQITTIQPINIDINQMDLELFLLLPHQISHNIEQLYNRYSQSKRPNAGKDTFCLYEDNNTPKNSGQGWAIGGPRGLTAFLVYPDNVRRENVAIKGRWWFEDDPAHPFSLCSNTNSDLAKDGCGDGQDGWSINIHSDMDYAWCSGDSLCAGVSATKADVFAWRGDRMTPGLSSQNKGGFKTEVTIFSRKNEFPPITEEASFAQTCGIGVERTGGCDGREGEHCCKIPYPSTEDPDFYYDFMCSPPGWQCKDLYTRGETDPKKQAVEQSNEKDIYCNFLK